MRNRFIFTMLSAFLLYGVKIDAQTAVQKTIELDIPEQLKNYNSRFCFVGNELIMPANGGLYSLSSNVWIEKPDSNDFLLSFQLSPDQKNSFFSVYHKRTQKTVVYSKSSADQKTVTIASLPQGFFYVKNIESSIFIYGSDEHAFHIYEAKGDALNSLYSSATFVPNSLMFLNSEIVLLAFGDRIVSLSKNEGLQELVHLNDGISSFAVLDNNALFVTTPQGLCLYQDNKLKVLEPGLDGELTLLKETLFLFSKTRKKLLVYKVSR